ncbi:MAG: class I SAM-dependent methyltransferase [Cyanobacteria bacterium P01_F01_bin.116]
MNVSTKKKQLFDRWAPFYDFILTSVFYQAIHKRLLDYVELPEKANILDIGCGTGRLLNRLAAKYPDLQGTGLDFSAEMLRQARRSNLHRPRLIFVPGNAAPLRFVDNQFDAVFNTISFLHYAEPERVLAEVYRVLRPNGMFYLVDLTNQSLTRSLHGEMRFYSRERRQQMGIQVGLKCIKHHHLLGPEPVVLTIFSKPS